MNKLQTSIGKDAAIALYESGWWKDKSAHDIVQFQLFTAELSMPFDVFHKATQDALSRPVWTHEFADAELLAKEFLGERSAPTFNEIIEMIPAGKSEETMNEKFGGIR
jgi:hypothetical protein